MTDEQKITDQSSQNGKESNADHPSHAHDLAIPGMGDKDRVFRVKKMTRLCAYAMAEDDKIDAQEMAVLTTIVWYDLLNGKFNEADCAFLDEWKKEETRNKVSKNITYKIKGDKVFLNDPKFEQEECAPDADVQRKIDIHLKDTITAVIIGHAFKKIAKYKIEEKKENLSKKDVEDPIKSYSEKLIAFILDPSADSNSQEYKEYPDFPEFKQIFLAQLRACFRFTNRLCANLKTEPARKSVFMNADGLKPDEMVDELRYIMCLIHADNAVSDVERESFRVFCKVCKIEHSTKIWRHLSKLSDQDLFEKRDLEITIKGEMDLNDFNAIKRSLEFYEIKGPIKESAHNALRREVDRKQETMFRDDRRYSKLAMVLFFATALIIYFFISDRLEAKVQVLNNDPHNGTVLSATNIKTCFEQIGDDLKRFFSLEFKTCKWIKCILLLLSSSLIVRLVSRWWTRNMSPISATQRNYKNELRRKTIKNRLYFIGLVLLPFLLMICLIFTWPEGSLPSFIERFFIPICLLIMMLSIEWLIFMRSKNNERIKPVAESKPNYSMLSVLVVAAIVLDMSIGVIELEREYEQYRLLEKCFSAVLLGCICFFSGKFIENHRHQQDFEIREMESIVEYINPKKVQENKPQECQQTVEQNCQKTIKIYENKNI